MAIAAAVNYGDEEIILGPDNVPTIWSPSSPGSFDLGAFIPRSRGFSVSKPRLFGYAAFSKQRPVLGLCCPLADLDVGEKSLSIEMICFPDRIQHIRRDDSR